MQKVLDSYIDPQFTYVFTQGPDVVRTRADALRDGINCVSLAHLAIRELYDYELPADLRCTEMFYDDVHFARLGSDEPLRPGDLVWHGLANPTVSPEEFVPQFADGELLNWSTAPVKHVSVYTGLRDAAGDPLLFHSTHVAGTNVVWPLRRFTTVARYRRMHGISRLRAA